MAHSFVVYVDESGDEGFTFRDHPHKGSSDWFVLTALIVAQEFDREVRLKAATIREGLYMDPFATIHFKDIPHEKRVRVISEIKTCRAKITSVIINKRRIEQPEIFTAAPFRLYFYATRLLMERVSWYCRDVANGAHLQNCEAKIVFEHRKHLSYEKLKQYFQVLQVAATNDAFLQLLTHDVRIHWPAINIDTITAAQKHDYAGLQLADCGASGIRWALEENKYGNTEHRHAKNLKPIIYHRNGNFAGYGMKFFPCDPAQNAACAHWLYKYYR